MTGETPAILSFQSRVVYGHVGHSVAQFALQRLGYDIWPIDSVILSTHPGHGAPSGRLCTGTEVGDLLAGIERHGLLRRVSALLSGYLGHAEVADAVVKARAAIAAAGVPAPFACDPVIGDRDCGVYIAAGLLAAFRTRLAPLAELLTPNHFELEQLVERPLPTLTHVVAAAESFLTGAARLVVVTSLLPPIVAAGDLGTLAVSRAGRFLVTTPCLPATVRGAGDLLTALILARWLRHEAVPDLLADAVSSTYALIAATVRQGAGELRLIAHQDVLIDPPVRYPALALG